MTEDPDLNEAEPDPLRVDPGAGRGLGTGETETDPSAPVDDLKGCHQISPRIIYIICFYRRSNRSILSMYDVMESFSLSPARISLRAWMAGDDVTEEGWRQRFQVRSGIPYQLHQRLEKIDSLGGGVAR